MTAKSTREYSKETLLETRKQLREIESKLIKLAQSDVLYDAIKSNNYNADILVRISPNEPLIDGIDECYGLRTKREPAIDKGTDKIWRTSVFGNIDRDVAIELFDECIKILKSIRDSYEKMSDEEWSLRRNSKVRI